MLHCTVQQLGDASVLRCRGRIVIGESYTVLRDAATSQGHVRLLVVDLAHVDRIDAGGLGVLLGLREWTQANGIKFKLMKVMPKVEQIFELTALDRVFEFCSVRDLLILLGCANLMPSDRFQNSEPVPDVPPSLIDELVDICLQAQSSIAF